MWAISLRGILLTILSICLNAVLSLKDECAASHHKWSTKSFIDLITDEEEDDEEVYKMAGVMAQCGGLECMLNRLSGIKDFKQGRHLLTVSQHFKAKSIFTIKSFSSDIQSLQTHIFKFDLSYQVCICLTYRFCWSCSVIVWKWRSIGSSLSNQRWTRSTSCSELLTWWVQKELCKIVICYLIQGVKLKGCSWSGFCNTNSVILLSVLENLVLISFSLQALVAEQESKDSGGASIAEQVLSIMEIILDEANAEISEDKVRN